MEPLTWTGAIGPYLNPALGLAVAVLALSILTHAGLAIARLGGVARPGAGAAGSHAAAAAGRVTRWSLFAVLALIVIYLVAGIVAPVEAKGIIGRISTRFLPVWIALAATFALSIAFKRRLGLYGNLFDNRVGMIGFALVMFWVYSALFADVIVTHDPVGDVISGMKNKAPGTPLRSPGEGVYGYYLLGGDALARDVFSRMVAGARVVLTIAPAATLFAFMVGITLGVPAGYLGGRFDTALSFVANLVLAFPVILLFFLLVTPEIIAMGVPKYMAEVLFLFPVVFLVILWNSRFHTRPMTRNIHVGLTVLIGGWLYLGLAWDADPLGLVSIPGGVLIVFVSVVFVNSPTVFRIVRGLTLDIRTRDYVAAAQTRGEGAWYIMLWEILPNARGPLLVDFCLRIGYTTILLGTLGFFGLGLPPDSPDWGTSINAGRGLLQFFPFPPLVPAVAIMSLVLGLNLLADGLREESLKD
ncbi:ABC transporter permease [Actibacterium sp. MT2.3-13A]|uniref:ABC transporter permease n=1 Tax=Actibacterium sp. MT2.3-13A TaxID=2828332 RepID=UPI001BA66CF2|nr:ABC transporter permease [Actibacterium sp. MT2.3-13A]